MGAKPNEVTISDFYCIECNGMIPLPRKRQREAGHLKKIWCPYCKKETNHVEIRPFGSYTYADFQEEKELGRFVGDVRVSLEDLIQCSNEECRYNKGKRCWNANNSYDCPHKPKTEGEMKNE